MGSEAETDTGGSAISNANMRKNIFLLSLIYLIIKIVPISIQGRERRSLPCIVCVKHTPVVVQRVLSGSGMQTGYR